MNILNIIGIIGLIISIISTLIIFYNHCKINNFYNIFTNRNNISPEIYQIRKKKHPNLNNIIIIKNPDNKIKIGIEKM